MAFRQASEVSAFTRIVVRVASGSAAGEVEGGLSDNPLLRKNRQRAQIWCSNQARCRHGGRAPLVKSIGLLSSTRTLLVDPWERQRAHGRRTIAVLRPMRMPGGGVLALRSRAAVLLESPQSGSPS